MLWQKNLNLELLKNLPLNHMEKLYRIEELETSGWTLVEKNDTSLTQDEARQRYNEILTDGISPDRVRIVREQ